TSFLQKDTNFSALFNSCVNLNLTKQLHALLIVFGKSQNVVLSTKLINLYVTLGDISLSRSTFNHINKKNIYSWNSIISAYVRFGRYNEAMNCVNQLFSNDLRPDFYTFPPILKACVDFDDGKKVHCCVFKMGFENDVFVAASLIHLYSRVRVLDVAYKVFVDMPVRDVGSWNAMISGFCQNGDAAGALGVLNRMKCEGVEMDTVTVSSILPVCAQSEDSVNGVLIHLYVLKHGLDTDVFVSNALINMYSKFGMQLVGIQPDLLTVVSLTSIFSQLSDQRVSRSIHGFIMRHEWIEKDIVIGNALVNMYAKLGDMNCAHTLFDQLPRKDVISWNTLITGYTQNGLASESIDAYNMMEECINIVPNQGTWVSIIPAYSHVGALQQGMKIHGRLIKNSLYLDVFVATCLIDMYGKCGKLEDAMSLFYEIPRETSVPWNAIISSLGVHGHGEEALQLFKDMLAEGVEADHITFVSLLSACSHSGLVDEGQNCFDIMQKKYGIEPSLKHYGCMVDLLGRAGYLKKAYDLVRNMPVKPDASIWGALLSACRIHGNAELGTLASERLLEVDSENVGYYVLLSNIYANTGKWEGVVKVFRDSHSPEISPNDQRGNASEVASVIREFTEPVGEHDDSNSPMKSNSEFVEKNAEKTSGHQVLLIAAADNSEGLPSTIRRSFSHETKIGPLTEEQRAEMLLHSLQNIYGLHSNTDLEGIVKEIVGQTSGFMPRDMCALIADAGANLFPSSNAEVDKVEPEVADSSLSSKVTEDNESEVSARKPEKEDLVNALERSKKRNASALGTPKVPKVKWDDVGGLEDVKKSILDTVQLPLLHKDLFASGLRKRSGVLLYGPPGTGKVSCKVPLNDNLLLPQISHPLLTKVFFVKGPELITMYIGESEKNVRDIFQKARSARPCVIFFDELDSLAPARGASGDSGGVMDRVVSQMLAEIDGLSDSTQDLFIIGASNRPDLVDPAFLRPGRFDKLLYVGVNSDASYRERVLKALTRKFKLHEDVSLYSIAKKCPPNFTGADMYALCADAWFRAAKRRVLNADPESSNPDNEANSIVVEYDDFVQVLEELQPSLSTAELKKYELLIDQFEGTSK
ncbi:hypothetical protein RYX36_030772, partial [Vicia faba]